MKTVYHILINRKTKIAKYVFFLILFGSYPIIYRTACHFLYNRYDYDSILYIGRLLILMDEPTNGIDTYGILQLKNDLNRCVHEGSAVIVTSHVLDFLEKYARAVFF